MKHLDIEQIITGTTTILDSNGLRLYFNMKRKFFPNQSTNFNESAKLLHKNDEKTTIAHSTKLIYQREK